jgi:thymidylate synthase (FAD)
MNVKLITHTNYPTRTVARAAWITHNADWPTDYDMHPDRSGPLVRRVLASGHDSILEHAAFTFAVDGISRACSHQLVRHRVASYSQQSQRYVELGASQYEYYATPESIAHHYDSTVVAEYACLMDEAKQVYNRMIAAGIPAEDARFILPNAAATKIVITMNARELHHFFALRCCTRAQWEIRNMARQMLERCKDVAPVLFENCGPGCLRGPCPEGARSCGEPLEDQGARCQVQG